MCGGRDLSNAGRRDCRAAGVTLLEIIIVIGILAIVMAMLLPAISQARQMSVRTACQANLHAIGAAVALYWLEHRSALPTHYGDSAIAFDTFRVCSDDGKLVNLGLLLSYVDDPKVFYCPSQDADTSPSIAYDSAENRWQSSGTGGSGGGGGGGGGSGGPPGSGGLEKAGPRPGVNCSYTARFRESGKGHAPVWNAINHTNKVIYSDFIGVDHWPGRGRFVGGIGSPHRGKGYNRLFGDGSVVWADAGALNELRPIGAAEPTAAELNQYYLLLDVLR